MNGKLSANGWLVGLSANSYLSMMNTGDERQTDQNK